MRNRAVEVQMSSPTLDSWQLVFAGLPATVGTWELLLREEGGLQAKGNKLAILRQDGLAGRGTAIRLPSCQLGLERRFAAVTGCSVLAARDSAVWSCMPGLTCIWWSRRGGSLAWRWSSSCIISYP